MLAIVARMGLTNKLSPEQAEGRMRGLLLEADLPEPDEVVHDAGRDELVFLWRDQKLAVVVELGNASEGGLQPLRRRLGGTTKS